MIIPRSSRNELPRDVESLSISSVRSKTPVNIGDFAGLEIQEWAEFEKEPVEWAFSQRE